MKNILSGLTLAALITTVITTVSAQACETNRDWGCGDPAFGTLVVTGGLTYALFLPFGLTTVGFQLSSGQVPNKEAAVRLAAVEAANYISDGSIGPYMQQILNANPDRTTDQIVDGILQTAEQL